MNNDAPATLSAHGTNTRGGSPRNDHIPPGPRGVPLVGNALHFRRDPLGFLTRAAREHGDVVRLTAGRQEMLFINHPALLESVLATNARRFTRSKSKPPTRLDYLLAGGEDVYRVINFPGDEDFWVRERHRFNPLLKGNALARYGPTMVRMAERHISTWQQGEIVEVHREMGRLSLDIVLNSLYGADYPDRRDEILNTCETIVRDITHRATHPFQAPPIVPTRENVKLRKAVREGREVMERVIRDHPEVHDGAGDLVDVLRRAGEAEPDLLRSSEWLYQMMALLIAGHETTAVALTWTWYLLAQHPSTAERLIKEVDATLHGRTPTKDDLTPLRWCDAVFKEALRLYPPVPIIPRMAYEEFTLDGYAVAPGHGDPDLPVGDASRRAVLQRGGAIPARNAGSTVPTPSATATCRSAPARAPASGKVSPPPSRYWPSPASRRTIGSSCAPASRHGRRRGWDCVRTTGMPMRVVRRNGR